MPLHPRKKTPKQKEEIIRRTHKDFSVSSASVYSDSRSGILQMKNNEPLSHRARFEPPSSIIKISIKRVIRIKIDLTARPLRDRVERFGAALNATGRETRTATFFSRRDNDPGWSLRRERRCDRVRLCSDRPESERLVLHAESITREKILFQKINK